MPPWHPRDHLRLLAYALRWLALTAPLALLVGSACTLFLYSLEYVTALRELCPWLLYLLPLAGLAIALLSHTLGRSSDPGTALLMEQIHTPGGGVPRRMAPLILLTTLLTHLTGGSAGREGTAVQMGGSIASGLARFLRLKPHDLRILLMAGIAAGFGGVFGTPIAGAVFALEVLALGRISYDALLPCLFASLLADYVCTAWTYHGHPLVTHTEYHHLVSSVPHFSFPLLGQTALAAIAFGLASALFSNLTHAIQSTSKRLTPPKLFFLRPMLGALLLIALVSLLGTRDYIGLGVHNPANDPTGHHVNILSAFSPGGADTFSWFWKLLLTALTLGVGFKGGEVTPLFFIGAALGNTLAAAFGSPHADLFAALGFVAVFSGATNTPLACTLMGVELFGADNAVYLATACFLAYLFSGHSGIYPAQRLATPKLPAT